MLVHGRRCTQDPLVPASAKCGYASASEALGVNEGVIYVVDVSVGVIYTTDVSVFVIYAVGLINMVDILSTQWMCW